MPKTTQIVTKDGEIQCHLNTKGRIYLGINTSPYNGLNGAYATMDMEDALDLMEELRIAILDLKEEEEQLQLQEQQKEDEMPGTDDEEDEEEVYEDDNLDEIYQVYPGNKEDE